ncbi:MAG: hypothetical protein AAF264_07350 [Pseudomonadota bacterium]
MAEPSKIEMGVGRSTRGGILSSRARRLSDRVEERKAPRRAWPTYIVLAVAGSLAAGLFYAWMTRPPGAGLGARLEVASEPPRSPGPGPDGMEADVAAEISGVPATDPVEEEDTGSNGGTIADVILAAPSERVAVPSEDAVAEPPDVAAQPSDVGAGAEADSQAVPAALTSDAEPVPDEAAPPRAGCVRVIEGSLARLHAESQEVVAWAVRQDEVTGLVQQVVDCPGVTFDVVGSTELLDRGLAALQMDWDRAGQALTLTIIRSGSEDGLLGEPVEGGATEPVEPRSDQPWTSFVLQ